MFFWDPTYLLLIPGLIFAIWAQTLVSSTYKKYSQVRSLRGLTGAQAAKEILRQKAYDRNVPIEEIPGELTDHFDPRNNVLRLSTDVFEGDSIAAIGIAAHEVGHALQHQEGYLPIVVRNSIVPLVNLSSTLAFPIFFIGFIFHRSLGFLLDLGIFLFLGAVFFHLITLPVEINASARAVAVLRETRILREDELVGVKKVLTAAALTYVASLAMALLELLRLIILRNSRD